MQPPFMFFFVVVKMSAVKKHCSLMSLRTHDQISWIFSSAISPGGHHVPIFQFVSACGTKRWGNDPIDDASYDHISAVICSFYIMNVFSSYSLRFRSLTWQQFHCFHRVVITSPAFKTLLKLK